MEGRVKEVRDLYLAAHLSFSMTLFRAQEASEKQGEKAEFIGFVS